MKTLFLAFLLLAAIPANAQFSQKNALYLTTEIGKGNYLGLNAGINYVYNQTYSFAVGFSGQIRKAKTTPADYSSGITGIFSFGLANPSDQMGTLYLTAGKIFLIEQTGSVRFHLSLGMGYTVITEPANWQPAEGGGITENYTYDAYSYGTISLIINPKIEFPFTRYFGLTLSPVLQLNKDRIYIGIAFGSMIGILKSGTF